MPINTTSICYELTPICAQQISHLPPSPLSFRLAFFSKTMGTHWLPSEDLQMCISFVRHSIDEYDGNKQKRDKLWETIHGDYMQNWVLAPGEKPPKEPRTRIALASHYNKFKLLLQKWGECLAASRQRIASGTSLMDEVSTLFYHIL